MVGTSLTLLTLKSGVAINREDVSGLDDKKIEHIIRVSDFLNPELNFQLVARLNEQDIIINF